MAKTLILNRKRVLPHWLPGYLFLPALSGNFDSRSLGYLFNSFKSFPGQLGSVLAFAVTSYLRLLCEMYQHLSDVGTFHATFEDMRLRSEALGNQGFWIFK